MTAERFETVIVGGGQAGLSTAYHLKQQGRPFVILDANERVGDAWRNRWDSLRLFTPAKYNGLDGWRFPAPSTNFPTKDEMGDYLEAYAARFELPVRTNTRVESLSRNGHGFVVTAGGRRYEADNVVVAAGAHQIPKVPDFAGSLDRRIRQLHSSEYRSPAQLKEGGVLIVGVGNSGAEIAFEVAKTHPVWISGDPSAQIPFKHGPRAARFALPMVRFLGHHVLTMRTPLGRKVGPKLIQKAAPLIRVKLKDLVAAGVRHVGRTTGVSGGRPVLGDGTVLDVTNVIWSTGFEERFPWIDLPGIGGKDRAAHVRGVVTSEPGLYFLGLPFQFAATSDTLPGVGRDARYIAAHIARGSSNGRRSGRVLTAAS